MELSTIQTLFSGLSGIGFLVSIIVLYRVGLLKYLMNGKNGDEQNNELMDRLIENQNELKLHFNEETTYELRKMNRNIETMISKLHEFEKYGIPCRNKDKNI